MLLLLTSHLRCSRLSPPQRRRLRHRDSQDSDRDFLRHLLRLHYRSRGLRDGASRRRALRLDDSSTGAHDSSRCCARMTQRCAGGPDDCSECRSIGFIDSRDV